MASTALITGGSGYFGSLLRDRLLAQGRTVRVLDLADASDRPRTVEFVPADIGDATAVEKACADCQEIYHCVAQVPLAKDRAQFHRVNVGGTENLLRAAQRVRAGKVIYVSSSAVFGVPERNPVDEATIPTPGEAYGRAKLDAEHLCHAVAREGVDVTIIRPRTIIGHGRLGIFQILFEWIRTGYNVPVLGNGENVYQFVHADDLADACILAAARPGATTYNCGTDRFGTMRAALEHICRHAGTKSKVRQVPMTPAIWGMNITSALGLSPLGPYHALMYGRSLYFDIRKAQSELGWHPRYSNEEMLAQSYDWYLQHRASLAHSSGGSHHRSPLREGILSAVKRLL